MAKKNLRFEGIEEIAQVLSALPGRLGPQVILKTLRKAAKPIVAEAKSRAPRDKGDLIRSIGVINGRGQGKGQSVYVGPRRGGSFKGYAGHLVEYGTGPRTMKDGGSSGSMPAQPFMRPAADSKTPLAIESIKLDLKTLIESGFKGVFK